MIRDLRDIVCSFESLLWKNPNIVLQTTPQESFQKLEDLVIDLGDKKSKWIKAINQQLKKDINIALALLFSEKAPQSKLLDQARGKVLDRDGCSPIK